MPAQLHALPNPFTLEWDDWVDTVVGFNPQIRDQGDPDLPWQLFAQRLTKFAAATPGPELFDDWRSWADALKSAYPS